MIDSFFPQLGFDSHMRISASNGLNNIAGGKPYVIFTIVKSYLQFHYPDPPQDLSDSFARITLSILSRESM